MSDLVLHRMLAHWNRERLRPGFIGENWPTELVDELELRAAEGRWVELERRAARRDMGDVPQAPTPFMRWFGDLARRGPGQGDPLFDWLDRSASREDMRWFLSQEAAGEAGFDDLVALVQVKLPARPKLEMARNYWDEMGRGNADGTHGGLLQRIVSEFAIDPQIETTAVESLALANLMVALAANRRYAYQAIGALGVIEMTAPGRVARVNAGLKRLGVPAAARSYFQLHAGLDVRHSAAWNREVIRPLVEEDPRTAQPIAEGAWMRLACGARCFERYRRELRVPSGAPLSQALEVEALAS